MNKKLLTVFTPTYNRAGLLGVCYEALKRQSSFNFEWIVVDDGSTDNTKELVSKWINEDNDFEIKYYYKKNGGLHTAYNLAIEKMDTELCMCIDSDDYPSDNAVELIEKCWDARDKSKEYAGIFGLDCRPDGELVGGHINEYSEINLVDWTMRKYPVKYGDKKIVVRVDLYKQVYPMGKYPGEKNFNPNYMNIQIGMKYNYIALDECLCFVDYQDTGMTNNMLWQYYNSPNSFAEIRLLYLSFNNAPLKFLVKHSIHYCSSCFLAKRKKFINKSPHPVLAALCVPVGFALSRYVLFKNRKK